MRHNASFGCRDCRPVQRARHRGEVPIVLRAHPDCRARL